MATILVIDDIPAVVMSLTVVLESIGHRVTGASNGKSGLALIRENRFDLVISDIWMPVIGGNEVIREGRRMSPGTRFLAITGGDPNRQAAWDKSSQSDFGADAVLLKPFATEDLLHVLMQLLETESGVAASQKA
jgi:CheY-like chemotaxis protein